MCKRDRKGAAKPKSDALSARRPGENRGLVYSLHRDEDSMRRYDTDRGAAGSNSPLHRTRKERSCYRQDGSTSGLRRFLRVKLPMHLTLKPTTVLMARRTATRMATYGRPIIAAHSTHKAVLEMADRHPEPAGQVPLAYGRQHTRGPAYVTLSATAPYGNCI